MKNNLHSEESPFIKQNSEASEKIFQKLDFVPNSDDQRVEEQIQLALKNIPQSERLPQVMSKQSTPPIKSSKGQDPIPQSEPKSSSKASYNLKYVDFRKNQAQILKQVEKISDDENQFKNRKEYQNFMADVKIPPSSSAKGFQPVYTQELIKLSNDDIASELSSNLSYQFARERSRAAICHGFIQSCFKNVENFQKNIKDEETKLQMIENFPISEYYVDKVLGRVSRMLQGEYLGDMVESDIENLQVDLDFENQRHMIEVVSTYRAQETIPSVKSSRSVVVDFKSEIMKMSEKVSVVSSAQVDYGMVRKYRRMLENAILKKMIQANCRAKKITPIQYQEQPQIMALEIVPSEKEIGIAPSNSQQPVQQTTTFEKGKSESNINSNSFYNLPDPVTSFKVAPDLSRYNSLKYQLHARKLNEDRGQSAPLKFQSSRKRSTKKSSKSSEVYIEEDDGPSLHETKKIIEPMELASSKMPDIMHYQNYEMPEENQVQEELQEEENIEIEKHPQEDYLDYEEIEPVRFQVYQGQLIDVEKSYEIIKQIQNESKKESSNTNSQNNSVPNKLFNIEQTQIMEQMSENLQNLDRSGGEPSVQVKKIEQQKKWREIMQFMEAHPQIMLELMPPTPGRRKNKSSSPEELGRTRPCTSTAAPSRVNWQQRPSTTAGHRAEKIYNTRSQTQLARGYSANLKRSMSNINFQRTQMAYNNTQLLKNKPRVLFSAFVPLPPREKPRKLKNIYVMKNSDLNETQQSPIIEESEPLPEISFQKSRIRDAIKLEKNLSKKSFSMYNQPITTISKKKKEIWTKKDDIGQQWPRVALNDSQKLLQNALNEVQSKSTIQKPVYKPLKKSRKSIIPAQALERLNLISQNHSPVSTYPLDKHLYRQMEPKVQSFELFSKGITESIKRLNPHKQIVNGEQMEFPAFPEVKSESPKSKQHKKRLAKLSKLRKSMKSKSPKNKKVTKKKKGNDIAHITENDEFLDMNQDDQQIQVNLTTNVLNEDSPKRETPQKFEKPPKEPTSSDHDLTKSSKSDENRQGSTKILLPVPGLSPIAQQDIETENYSKRSNRRRPSTVKSKRENSMLGTPSKQNEFNTIRNNLDAIGESDNTEVADRVGTLRSKNPTEKASTNTKELQKSGSYIISHGELKNIVQGGIVEEKVTSSEYQPFSVKRSSDDIPRSYSRPSSGKLSKKKKTRPVTSTKQKTIHLMELKSGNVLSQSSNEPIYSNKGSIQEQLKDTIIVKKNNKKIRAESPFRSDKSSLKVFLNQKFDFNQMNEAEIMKMYQQQQQFLEQFNKWKSQNEEPTPRVNEPQALEHKDIVRARGEYRITLLQQDIIPPESLRFDWSKTDIFKQTLKFTRFKMPSLTDTQEQSILSSIDILRRNPEQYQRAHILMPIFEIAMSYIEKLLCNSLNLNALFAKIKNQYICIDYHNTLKLLVRSKLCIQMKDDACLMLCKYLDFMEELRNIQQLRDEEATDEIIVIQINKLQKHGEMFIYRTKKFQGDYQKIFKQNKIWLGDIDIAEEVQDIMIKFGIYKLN